MITSPKNKNELIESLKSAKDDTFLIAGGTDLIIKLWNSKITDYNLIDLTKLEEFKYIKEDEDFVRIGAITTITDILNSDLIKEKFSALYRASYDLGSTIIRNRATIGGNISHASQSADCSLALFSYGAKVKVLSADGSENIIDIDDFVIGREETILTPKDILVEILIPKKDRISTFVKIGSRKTVTISKISSAIDTEIFEDKLKNVKVFLGAVGIKPVRAKEIENYLEGKSFDDIDLEKVQNIAFDEVQNAIPTRVSRFYKREAIKGLIEDLIKELRLEYERI